MVKLILYYFVTKFIFISFLYKKKQNGNYDFNF